MTSVFRLFQREGCIGGGVLYTVHVTAVHTIWSSETAKEHCFPTRLDASMLVFLVRYLLDTYFAGYRPRFGRDGPVA